MGEHTLGRRQDGVAGHGSGGPGGPPRSSARWCPGRDLNPDELPHTPLKRTRIPIPPPGHDSRGTGIGESLAGDVLPRQGRGTEEGSRTHTPLRALAPEASASTSSATSARTRSEPGGNAYRPFARRHVSTS